MKELKMFIDGRFIENESGKWIKVLNPSTEEVISLMPDGTVEDARKAIDAAEKAQNQWERTPSSLTFSGLTIILISLPACMAKDLSTPSYELAISSNFSNLLI